MLRWEIIMLCMKLMVVSSANSKYSAEYVFTRSYQCQETTYMDFDGDLTVLEGIGRGYNFTADVEDPITNDYQLEIVVDQWNNGVWDNFFNLGKGPACDVLKKYDCMPCKLWAHIRREVKPPIKDMCYIEPGHYKLSRFHATADDLNDDPLLILGTYRTTLRLYDEYDHLMICEVFEVEIDQI